MLRRSSTLDRIANDFAEAVASADFARAEGWAAAAFLRADRVIQQRPAHARRRGRWVGFGRRVG